MKAPILPAKRVAGSPGVLLQLFAGPRCHSCLADTVPRLLLAPSAIRGVSPGLLIFCFSPRQQAGEQESGKNLAAHHLSISAVYKRPIPFFPPHSRFISALPYTARTMRTVSLSDISLEPILIGDRRHLLPLAHTFVIGREEDNKIGGLQLSFQRLGEFLRCLLSVLPKLLNEEHVDEFINPHLPQTNKTFGEKITGGCQTEFSSYKTHFRLYRRLAEGFVPTKAGCTLDGETLQEFIKKLDKAFFISARFGDRKTKDFVEHCVQQMKTLAGDDLTAHAVDTQIANAHKNRLFHSWYSGFRHPLQHDLELNSFYRNHSENLTNLMLIYILQDKLRHYLGNVISSPDE